MAVQSIVRGYSSWELLKTYSREYPREERIKNWDFPGIRDNPLESSLLPKEPERYLIPEPWGKIWRYKKVLRRKQEGIQKFDGTYWVGKIKGNILEFQKMCYLNRIDKKVISDTSLIPEEVYYEWADKSNSISSKYISGIVDSRENSRGNHIKSSDQEYPCDRATCIEKSSEHRSASKDGMPWRERIIRQMIDKWLDERNCFWTRSKRESEIEDHINQKGKTYRIEHHKSFSLRFILFLIYSVEPESHEYKHNKNDLNIGSHLNELDLKWWCRIYKRTKIIEKGNILWYEKIDHRNMVNSNSPEYIENQENDKK